MSKNHCMWSMRVAALTLFIGTPASFAAAPKVTLRAMFVEGLPDFHCSIADDSSVKNFCSDFVVQVFLIKGPDNVTIKGCVAALPYNKVTVHTGPSGKVGTVAWVLKQKNIVFDGAGLDVKIGQDEAFDPAIPVVEPTKKRVELKTRAGVKVPFEYNHKPLVRYTLASGSTVLCTGIDPVIINSAD